MQKSPEVVIDEINLRHVVENEERRMRRITIVLLVIRDLMVVSGSTFCAIYFFSQSPIFPVLLAFTFGMAPTWIGHSWERRTRRWRDKKS